MMQKEKESLGRYLDVLDYALIRARWYEQYKEDRYLDDSIQAIESALIMFKHYRSLNSQAEPETLSQS